MVKSRFKASSQVRFSGCYLLWISIAYFSVYCLICSEDVVSSLHSKSYSLRVKRQQPSAGETVVSSNQPQNSAALTPPVSAEGTSGAQDVNNQDEKAGDEAQGSLKCDFGTSDSPDLCKFKIIESTNPISKGLATWSLGSGKLALFQGGPLVDASDRNDTNGGYIFYETSNPFASSNHSSTAPSSSHAFDGNRPTENIYNDYTIISTHNSIKQTHRGDQHSSTDSFQQVASGRISVGSNLAGPAFLSPNLTAPGPSGMCLSFQYAIQGLSAEELRIQVNDHKTGRSRLIWASSESAASNWTRGDILYSATNVHSIMFTAAPGSSPLSKDLQQRRFRGYIALDEIEINKHDPAGSETACKGHCNFDGDLCGWTNGENGQDDDFDWSFGRGSDNLFTGPPRDYTSSSNNEMTGSYLFTDSGYPRRPGDRAVLISPMFQPTPVNDAMCMRVAVHMFGSGIGSLIIKIRYAEEVGPVAPTIPGQPAEANAQPPSSRSASGKLNNELPIWEMSGDAGNRWHQAQTSISSSKSPFQVIIEGVIGENHLGNIAIDEISFSSGPCPTSPPVASKNYGDCTFEQSMCYWRNPDADMHLDDLDWVRSADEQSIHGPNFDHTLKKKSGSYLKLENTFREPRSGTRAFLLSPIFQPKPQGTVQCLSFYYYMFMRSIGSSGPSLGTIRVYLASNNELIPIWRLTNPISSPNWKHGRASLSTAMVDGQAMAPTKLFQIAFEGIWGDSAGGAIAIDDITVFDGACEIMPAKARSVPGECTFDVDMCSWSNKTSDLSSSSESTDSSRSPFILSVNSASGQTPNRVVSSASKRLGWQLATVDSRPVNLQDHTYKAPIGYAYIDVLESGAQVMLFPLQSAEVSVQAGTQVTQCLSFWFAGFGRQENNLLNVYMTQASAPPPGDEESAAPAAPTSSARQSSPTSMPAASNPPGAPPSAPMPPKAAVSSGSTEPEAENSNAWKSIDGKLLWSISLKNMTETNRRKWLYGQVSLKADSNYIVRFVGYSNDGGFALDDISYYDGPCETRPITAKVQSEEDIDSSPVVTPKPPS